MGYIDNFVFNEEIDSKGNRYKKAYSNKLISCIICIDGKNIECTGRFNMFTRSANNNFKEELGIYFKIEDICNTYKTLSKHEVVEFYIDKEIGIKFIDGALKHFKQ